MAELPCPNCGSALAFLDQYQRYYCLRCGQYAPEGYGDRGARHCATCGGILSFVTQYNRFYCYHCNVYSSEEATPAPAASPAQPTPAAATQATPAETAPASPSSTALVATSPPAEPTPPTAESPPTTPAVTPHAETGPAPAAEPGAKPPEAPAAPVAATEPAAALPTPEPVPQGPSPEMRKLATSRPGVVRVKVFTLKRAELIDLCKVYHLDASGSKEQVQERLLGYLHSLEAEGLPSGEPSPEPAGPTVEPRPASTPVVEPVSEPPRVSAASVASPAAVVPVVPFEKPAVETVAEGPAPGVAEAPHPTTKVEHPCPTCGRELTFIPQYDRYYCYFCQRYAPVTRVKGACPTCGATMRWIDQHQRWWCDSCQKYASADLPKPANAAVPAPRAVASAVAAAQPVVIHHHASPAAGMGLIGLGLALWIIYEVLGVLAPAMNLAINNPFTGSLGDFMVFFAVIFVAGGALIGLSSLRDRV